MKEFLNITTLFIYICAISANYVILPRLTAEKSANNTKLTLAGVWVQENKWEVSLHELKNQNHGWVKKGEFFYGYQILELLKVHNSWDLKVLNPQGETITISLRESTLQSKKPTIKFEGNTLSIQINELIYLREESKLLIPWEINNEKFQLELTLISLKNKNYGVVIGELSDSSGNAISYNTINKYESNKIYQKDSITSESTIMVTKLPNQLSPGDQIICHIDPEFLKIINK
jgi:hypothetical protein